MLYWNTVEPLLKETLLTLMQADEIKEFRLVGGTAMSLHLGHRMSVDIDLFTDANYGSIAFESIDDFFKRSYPYVSGDFGGNPGMGKSYLVGKSPDEVIKLDIYYAMDPFFSESCGRRWCKIGKCRRNYCYESRYYSKRWKEKRFLGFTRGVKSLYN